MMRATLLCCHIAALAGFFAAAQEASTCAGKRKRKCDPPDCGWSGDSCEEIWVGCYVDDSDRMFNSGPMHDKLDYDGVSCNAACSELGATYFSLQNQQGWCACGNEDDFDKKDKYAKVDDADCKEPEEKWAGYRGGGFWKNAVYKVVPEDAEKDKKDKKDCDRDSGDSDGEDTPTKRQWIFNIGQDGKSAEHYLWNAHKSIDNVQFGAWSGAQIKTVDFSTASTLATTYDGEAKTYKLYLDGVLAATKEDMSLNIKSGDMTIGQVPQKYIGRESDYQGCVRGVDVYRALLTDDEVAQASEKLWDDADAAEDSPTPDYESRPDGACASYEDVLPGDPLQGSSHTIVMALQLKCQRKKKSADPEVWVGCYVDDSDRMFNSGPMHDKLDYDGVSCNAACSELGATFFSLQNQQGWCACGNEDDFDKKDKYAKVDDADCKEPEEKWAGYRGGGFWRNAVYKVMSEGDGGVVTDSKFSLPSSQLIAGSPTSPTTASMLAVTVSAAAIVLLRRQWRQAQGANPVAGDVESEPLWQEVE